MSALFSVCVSFGWVEDEDEEDEGEKKFSEAAKSQVFCFYSFLSFDSH